MEFEDTQNNRASFLDRLALPGGQQPPSELDLIPVRSCDD